MDKLDILTRSIQGLINQPDLKINLEAKLIEDFCLESIDFLDLACDLEKELNRDIDIKEIFKKYSEQSGKSHKEITVGDFLRLL